MLTGFLEARIAEDEATALKFPELGGREWGMIYSWDRDWACPMWVTISPVRVLAECKAKRLIIELADEATGIDMSLDGDRLVGKRDWPYVGDEILAALALPYADHPDYREEWKV